MTRKVSAPRVLPVTIFVIATLLGVKGASIVRAATPAAGAQSAVTEPRASAVHPAAAGEKPASAATPSAAAPDSSPPGGEGAAPPPPISDAERALLLELRQRRGELDARATAIGEREAMLQAAELKLQARVAELEALQKKLEQLEAARQDRDDANWRGLVKTYENMKPRDAAAIFNDLDMTVLLQVVDRMKEAKTAPVLAAMQPDKARELTSALAQMRAKTVAVGSSDAAASPGQDRAAK